MLIALFKFYVNFLIVNILWICIQIQIHSDKIFLILSFCSVYLLSSVNIDLFNLVWVVSDNFL